SRGRQQRGREANPGDLSGRGAERPRGHLCRRSWLRPRRKFVRYLHCRLGRQTAHGSIAARKRAVPGSKVQAFKVGEEKNLPRPCNRGRGKGEGAGYQYKATAFSANYKQRNSTMFTLILTVLISWLFIAPPASPAATSDEIIKKAAALSAAQRKTFLEEGARREGELVFYTSLSLTDYPKIMPYFEKNYPFIKTNTYRSTPSGVFTRADTEALAGRYSVDVIGSAPVEMWKLKQRKLSAPYLSPEQKALPSGSHDAEGYWQGFEVTPLVLAFNTKQVSFNDAPRSYQDLLNPKWKGKMSLGTEE